MKKKTSLYWLLAVAITLAAVVFQRMTGPTHPERVHFVLNGAEYQTKLPRSVTTGEDYSTLKFTIKNLPPDIAPCVFVRNYKSQDRWTSFTTQRKGDLFLVQLPSAPAAAKIEYYLQFTNADSEWLGTQEETVVARFRNDVPAGLMIPHILLMFAAMLLSTLSGLLAFFRRERYMGYAKIGFACLLIGGFVFGCIIQKIAFGQYWTGIPFGSDLTDNKTLLALVVWLAAIISNWRANKHPFWITIAAIFMLLVYSIPHSTRGSEYNYESGQVETGR